MKAIVVIPCFNEELNLLATCGSLGFGTGKQMTPENALLVLVNNNSTDSTIEVAEIIRVNSAENTVTIVLEPEQGFVPARRCGNRTAAELAKSNNWNNDNVIIIQADADTEYSENYINLLRKKAKEVGENFLIEGAADYPYSFKLEYQYYIDLCSTIDNKFSELFSSSLSEDVIVDDKAVAYRLSDYYNWGQHGREYNSLGDEIYAETTRLYIKARAKGARRVIVDDAFAFHSVRKILKNPALHLVTAGFPREVLWNKSWQRTHLDNFDLKALSLETNDPKVIEMINIREKHLIALFCILPLHVRSTMSGASKNPLTPFDQFVTPFLPKRTLNHLSLQPAVFLTDVFDLIEREGDLILSKAYKFCFQS